MSDPSKRRHLAVAHHHAPEHSPTPNAAAPAAGTAVDPVCGMTVAVEGPLRVTHEGQTYHCCSQRCVTRFRANPAAFLHPAQAPAPAAVPAPVPAGAQVQWTCPMHPEILRD